MRHSLVLEKNPNIQDLTDEFKTLSNLDFFARVGTLLKDSAHQGIGAIGLVGRKTLTGYLLRQAQLGQRWDFHPSLWSHCFLLPGAMPGDAAKVGDLMVWECTLDTAQPGYYPELNGVQEGRLSQFASQDITPNVGLICFDITRENALKIIQRASEPNLDRSRYNLWDQLGIWQQYIWSIGQNPNPLNSNHRLPSAAYVEFAYEGINLHVTPGAVEVSSSPEQISQAAQWYWKQYEILGKPARMWICVREEYPTLPDALAPRLNMPTG